MYRELFRKRSWQYNLFSLLKQNTAPNGAVSTYDYDKKGNRIASTDALGRIRKILALDATGRSLKTQDENGIVISSINAQGQTTTYAYDLLNPQWLALQRSPTNHPLAMGGWLNESTSL